MEKINSRIFVLVKILLLMFVITKMVYYNEPEQEYVKYYTYDFGILELFYCQDNDISIEQDSIYLFKN